MIIDTAYEICRSFAIAKAIYWTAVVVSLVGSAFGGESWFDGDEPAVIERPVQVIAPPPPIDDVPVSNSQSKNATPPKNKKKPGYVCDETGCRPIKTFADVLAAGIDCKEPNQELLTKTQKQPKIKVIGYAPDWCEACWRVVGRELNPACKLVAISKHPAFDFELLMDERPDCDWYPMIYVPEMDYGYYKSAIATPEELLRRIELRQQKMGLMKAEKAIPVGTIDRETVESLRTLCGETGSFFRTGKSWTFKKDSFFFTVSGGCGVAWSTSGGQTTFKFDGKKPVSGFRGTGLSVNSVTVSESSVSLGLDWAPDFKWSIK